MEYVDNDCFQILHIYYFTIFSCIVLLSIISIGIVYVGHYCWPSRKYATILLAMSKV
jgi:hypothetical protein